MADPDSDNERKVCSFGLDNSRLHDDLHQYVGFSPRFRRELTIRAKPRPETSSTANSPPQQGGADGRDVQDNNDDAQVESSKARDSLFVTENSCPPENGDANREWEDELAQALYGNLFGKPKQSKAMRERVEKAKATKAENRRKRAEEEKIEWSHPGIENKAWRKSRASANGKARRSSADRDTNRKKKSGDGVRSSKGHSFDGVTKHVTVKADRKRYGIFADAAKERGLKRAPEDEDVGSGNGGRNNKKKKGKGTANSTSRKQAKRAGNNGVNVEE
ncbi:MAG: hypothetical protein M1822_007986 [Bathelium mastoideum]|nr:MAG: hypothetical protein M1822_007986 [Bathelium mastoideum]